MAKTQDSTPQWRPFTPDSAAGRPSVTDRVTILRSGQIRVSEDLVERLGKPSKIQMLINGEPSRFAICPATAPMGAVALSRAGRQSEFRAARLLGSFDKDAARLLWPLDVPHSWDGDCLVIDISGVPTAEARP